MSGNEVKSKGGLGAASEFAALASILVGLVVVVGAIILTARLVLRKLPFTIAGQLPTEFMIFTGGLAVLPSLLVGTGYWLYARRKKAPGEAIRRAAIAAAVVLTAISVSYSWIPLERATICASEGWVREGFFIGETPDRIYIGESGKMRRIASVPLTEVSQLYIGRSTARCLSAESP